MARKHRPDVPSPLMTTKSTTPVETTKPVQKHAAKDHAIAQSAKAERPNVKEVMLEQMYFFRNKAMAIGNKIAEALKDEGDRGQDLVALFKHMTSLRKEIVDIAAKIAPYEHAKLESVSIKQEVEHRFVVRAPAIAKDAKDFFKSIGHKEAEPIVSAKPFLVDSAPRDKKDRLVPTRIEEEPIDYDADLDEEDLSMYKYTNDDDEVVN